MRNRNCPAAPSRQQARSRSRSREIASFILDAVYSEGVHIGVVPNPYDAKLGPSVFAWAPHATSIEIQSACETSFRDAVENNLLAIRVLLALREAAS
jgi:hypothetical protein